MRQRPPSQPWSALRPRADADSDAPRPARQTDGLSSGFRAGTAGIAAEYAAAAAVDSGSDMSQCSGRGPGPGTRRSQTTWQSGANSQSPCNARDSTTITLWISSVTGTDGETSTSPQVGRPRPGQGWQGRAGSLTSAPRPATPVKTRAPRPATPSDPGLARSGPGVTRVTTRDPPGLTRRPVLHPQQHVGVMRYSISS